MYSEMIFLRGFIHCDPHPGNVLVRRGEAGKIEIVLLDHGLYTVSVIVISITLFKLYIIEHNIGHSRTRFSNLETPFHVILSL